MRNSKKKILFLTHYFPPEVNAPANRTFEHCRIWSKEDDIEVTVITNFPNHPEGKIFNGYKNKFISYECVEGINVIRLLTFITANEGFLLRTFNFIFYLLMSFGWGIINARKYSVIVATSPQFFCGLSGALISKVSGVPFVLELRDLWPESIVAVGAIKNKSIIKVLETLEFWLYKKAELIISVTASFKKELIKKGIEKDKIKIIYNGVDTESFIPGGGIKNNDLLKFLEENWCAGYIGTLGMAHGLDTLINAASLLVNEKINIVIVGSGAEREKLENEIREKKIPNIRIFPLMPRSEAAEVLNRLKVFIVHLKKNDLFKTVIPSKIFEGMALKKAILIGVDGEAREIIEEAECGVFFEPENENDLAGKLLTLKKNEALLNGMGESGYNFMMKNFDRKKLAQKMLDNLREVLK